MATVPRLQRYYQGATTSCPRMSFGLLFSPAGSAGACRVRVRPERSRRRTGPATDRGLDFHAGNPLSSVLARGQEQDLPGSLATHPVTLRRSTTPDDPLHLASSGASGAAPTRLTMKASSIYRFRGFPRRFITCCLRFTTGVTARHARLASGWRAAPLPGGSRTRWIATRGFRSSHPPPQGFPWRNNRSAKPWDRPAHAGDHGMRPRGFRPARSFTAAFGPNWHGIAERLRAYAASALFLTNARPEGAQGLAVDQVTEAVAALDTG